MKKILFLGLAVTIISAMLVIQSCNNEDGPTDPLVGKYIISAAVLMDPLVFQGDTVLAANTDMTAAINAALLTSAGCDNLANTRLELKNNGQIWYVCSGEDTGFSNGTWEINGDRTELSLALNIPQGSTTVTALLKITDLDEGTLKVSGTTTIPLPPEFFLAFGVDLTASGVPIFQTKIHIEITRML
ncbi:MAG TPA: hypothetical protein VI583_03980 [Cyclobacteriaceae bacterium]|nr:hypothetical protein [Cyclobacteriaceae bacterium]